jgi:hypothetical protein
LRAFLPLAFLLLGACSTVGHERVEGWPELTIVEHRVSASEMYDRCRKYVGFGALPMACAEFNLATRRCDIWLIQGFAPRSIVEHERLHCRGHDHVGETSMRDFLARWQAYQAAVGASQAPVIAAEAAQ